MEEIITQMTVLAGNNAPVAYCLLFASAFVENVFPPVPGDTVTLVGAYFVGTGSLTYSWVLISTTLGSVGGFLALYELSRRASEFVLDEKRNRWIDTKKIVKVNRLFNRYGYWIILFNRFLSGIRSMISLSAGLSDMNTLWVALLATLSALVWNGAIIYLGAYIGKSWQEIQSFLDVYNQVVIAILIGLALTVGVIYFVNRRWNSGNS